MPEKPAFMIHTGDISHLSKPAQFDTAPVAEAATGLTTYTVPGEHDILEEDGKSYLNRFGKGTQRRRLVQLQRRRRALHRPGQCGEPARATGWAISGTSNSNGWKAT